MLGPPTLGDLVTSRSLSETSVPLGRQSGKPHAWPEATNQSSARANFVISRSSVRIRLPAPEISLGKSGTYEALKTWRKECNASLLP
jgi:hypothetical protein